MDESRYPVYVIAHNPNTIEEVDEVLPKGVNALEPDIAYNPNTRQLCISHDVPGKEDDPPTLEEFLLHIKKRLGEYPALSLILFDIKLDKPEYDGIPIAEWGTRLHTAINELLKDTGLAVIYSVSKTAQVGIFSDFALDLGPKEGIMVDQESEVTEMLKALEPLITKGVTNIAYADGCYAYAPAIGIPGHVRNALDHRALTGAPHLVGTWVLPSEKTIRQYLRMGVDGMIVTNDSIQSALDVINSAEFIGRLRLGVRDDNPFLDEMLHYGIAFDTLNRKLAGTDALVSCTLSGPLNAVTFFIDTSFTAGKTTLATIKMREAGSPLTISLSHDGSGIASDWLPDRVRVFEKRTGLNVSACIGDWLHEGELVTRQLGVSQYILKVFTGDSRSAGTDADILFTLHGAKGILQRRINAVDSGLFERNAENRVDIMGMDIGDIMHVSVETDGSGNASEWYLDKISVLLDNAGPHLFIFNQWITGNNPVTQSMEPVIQ